MDSFFERYGRLIIVAVVVCFVLLLFTPMKNKIGDNINGFVGNFANQTNKSLNEVRMPDELGTGDVLEIGGKKYIVINHIENSKYLLLSKYAAVSYKSYQLNERLDRLNKSIYENSDADNYLEKDWYNKLSSTMKAAIQATDIKQISYADRLDLDSKQETGYNGQVYNTISRHAFLPSIEELNTVVDLMNIDKVQDFLNGETIWSRDSYKKNGNCVLCLHSVDRKINIADAEAQHRMRPAFVIDLSQVDYTEAGHVDYK